MKLRWYYNWHLNPFVHVIHASILGLYLIGLGVFGYTFFQNPSVTQAASEKSWATADTWSQWQLDGLQIQNDQIILLEGVSEGTATLEFDPLADETVDWLSSSSIASGQTGTKFSTDNILWNDKIEDLADSNVLYVKISLNKDEVTPTLLSSFAISYSRYPVKPTDLAFAIKKGFLADKYLLSAGTFSDPDADLHAASEWQVTDTSGDYANLLFDSGSVTNGDLNSYVLDRRLSEGQYFFRVRYQDSVGAWSLWSDECAFTVEKDGHKVAGVTNGTAQQIANRNEILSSRTEKTKTIDNKNDTKTLEAYTGIIHYKEDYAAADSQWQDINPDHSVDAPDYVLYDQMPSTVKVFKDKIGYEIESRKTGDKYTVVLNGLDGAPVLSKSKGVDSKVAWADINTPAAKQQKDLRSAIAKWITPNAYADTVAVDDGNLKFEFEISEYGVRLWKTIKGEDAPKNFKWDITRTNGAKDAAVDDLKFRDKPEAFEIVNGADARDKQITIEAKNIEGAMDSNFVWQETAPKSDIKIDTDVTFYPDSDPENWTVDGTLENYDSTWAGVRDAATADIVDDASSAFYGAHVMNYGNTNYAIARSFFSFEVGYLAGKTITAATFSAWGESKTSSNGADPDLGLYYSSPFSSNSALSVDDYAKVGNTPLSSAIDYAGFSTTGYNNFVLNPAGIGYIQGRVDSGGFPAYLAMKTYSYDALNTSPSTIPGLPHSGDLNVYFADQAGSGQDPKLTLTYGTGGKTSMADVWVPAQDFNNVRKFDVSDGSIQGTVGTQNTPSGVAVDGNGFVWVTNSVTGSVSKINSVNMLNVGDFATGNNAYAVAVDANGDVWVANYDDSTVSKMSGSTGAKIGDYPTGVNPDGIAIDGNGYAWVSNYGDGTVSKIQVSDGSKIFDYPVGSAPMGVAVDENGNIWVANNNDGTVSKINGATGAKFGDYPTGSGAAGVAADGAGYVWVTNNNVNTVSQINITNGLEEHEYATGAYPNAVSIDGNGYVWVVNVDDSNISKINMSTGIIAGSYATSPYPNYGFGDMTGFAFQRFVAPQVPTSSHISGIAYNDDIKSGVHLGASVPISLSVDGGAKQTVMTDVNGAFDFTATGLAADIPITLFIDDPTDTYFGTLVTVLSGSGDLTGLNLYSGIGLSHENAGPLTNTILAVADNCADPKLRFSIDGSNKFSSIGGAYVLAGKTYRPGGVVESMSWFYVYGTLDMVTHNFDGSMGSPSLYTGGTINAGTGTFNVSSYHQFAGTFNGNTSTIVVAEYSFILDAGVFNATSGSMTFNNNGNAGNLAINGGTFNHNNGQVIFTSIGIGLTSNITSGSQHFYTLIANSANGTVAPLDPLIVDNELSVTAANDFDASASTVQTKNLTLSSGTFKAPSSTLKISGDYVRTSGSFDHNIGTVELNGAGGTTQRITKSDNFYNLTAAATANRTIQITASTTQTVFNTLSINGTDSSHKIILVSSSPGTRWNIDPQGSKSVSWVTVSDSTSTNPIDATNSTEGTPSSTTNWLSLSGHTLTYSAVSHGSIVGANPQTVADGADGTEVVATPDANYHWVSWSDGYLTAARTDLNVTGDITVSASFAINTHTLTYAPGSNGSITGSLSQTVNHGANGTEVIATPAAHYHFTSWSDGVLTAARTDTNVVANISVTASFAIDTYTLTYAAGSNGSITGTLSQTVNYGANGSEVIATAIANYHFTSWSDGVLTAARTDTNVIANISVTASFAINTYTLTYTPGSNGSITGSLSQTVNYGADGTEVIATPAVHYHFTSWSDGVLTAARTDTVVTANKSVTASFAIDTYTLTYSHGANGSITGATPQTVGYGANGTEVVATPAANYHFVTWSDGILTAARTDTNITANKSVTASFTVDMFTITSSRTAYGGGGISPDGATVLPYGSSQNYDFTAAPGFYLSQVLIDGIPLQGGLSNSYNFAFVSASHSIVISFVTLGSCVWDGGREGITDDNWSSADNWSGNSIPTASCDVVFSNASTDSSIVNSLFTNHIRSLSMRSGYTGTVSLNNDLNIDGAINLASGTLSAFNYTLNIAGSWNNTGGIFAKGTSTVVFDSVTVSGVEANSQEFYRVTFAGVAAISTPNVWVANYNTNNVSKIDSSTGAKTGDYPASNYSYGSAVDASGYVWVTNMGTDTVSKINASTGAKIIDYPTGLLPKGVAIDADGYVWVANYSSSTVSKITPSSGARTNYATGAGPTGVAIDSNGFAWVTNYVGGTVSKINVSTGTKTDYATGLNPTNVAVDASGFVWVVNVGANTVSKINAITGAKIIDYATGITPAGVAVGADGYVWVANTGSGTVSKINPTTGAKTDRATGTTPAGVSVDSSGYVWVANTGSNNVSKINGLTGTKVDDYPVGTAPYSFGDMTGYALQKIVLGGIESTTATGSYSLSSNLSVSDELTISSGVVTAGAYTISAGKFIQNNGYFVAPSTTLSISGDFQRSGGVFVRNGGTVSLTGGTASIQIISGSTTFHNLSAISTTARSIQFASDSSQAVLGTWTATGSSGQLLTLALKTGDTGVWNIKPTLWNVNFVNVSNSTNYASTRISPISYDLASLTANNTNWFSDVILSHTIVASVVSGSGTITPSGNKSVVDGQNQTFTITPAEGYHVSDIKVDGISLLGTLPLTYTFSVVIADHTIAVTFTVNDYCIWDGGAADENWSSASNWSNDTLPSASCDVIFNSTSIKNSNIDSGFTSHIKSFAINGGYLGTVTASNDLSDDGNFTQSAGTFFASSFTTNIAGSLFIAASPAAVFDKDTGTINFNPTTTGKTITTNGQQLGNLTFNGVSRDLTGITLVGNNNVLLIKNGILTPGWTLQDGLIATSVAVNTGTLVDAGKSVSVAGNISIANKIGLLASTGLWTQSASGNVANFDMRNAFGSLTIAGVGVTTTLTSGVRVGLNDGSAGSLTIGPGTVDGKGFTVVDYMRQSNNLTINNPIMKSRFGTFTMYPLGNYSHKAITLPDNFAIIQIQKGASTKFTATGDFNLANNNLGINNDSVVANTGYVDIGAFNLTCGNLTIGSNFGSAVNPTYYQIAGGLKLSTGTINVGGMLTAANPLNFGNTLNLGSGTLTVGGKLDLNSITFIQGTSTVDLIGTGALSAKSNTYFYNLKVAHPGKITVVTSDLIRVNNILYAYEGGTLANKYIYLYKSDGDPFIDTGATLTGNLVLYMSTTSMNVSGHKFSRVLYRAYTNDVTYTLTSNLSAASISIYSNTVGKRATLNTSSNNVTAGDITLSSGVTDELPTSSASINFGTGAHTISNSIKRYADSVSTDSSVDFGASTVSIGGDVNFEGLLVNFGSSTIKLNGTAGSAQTVYGNNIFNNLSITTSATRSILFASGTTQKVLGTWTATGASSQYLNLALKTGDNGIWNIDPVNWAVDYVRVKDSTNLASKKIEPVHYIDEGGNTNWFTPKIVPVTPITVLVEIGGVITRTITVVGDVTQTVVAAIAKAATVTSSAIRSALATVNMTPEEATAAVAVTVAVSTALVTAVLVPAMATGSLANIGEIFRSIWQPIANLVTGKRRRNWGRVIEEGTGAPIKNTKIILVKVYRESPTVMYESQKVVASTYTDKFGKYGFIAEPGKYKLEIVKNDYNVVDTNSFLDFYHTNTLFEVRDYKQGLVIKDVALSATSKDLEKMFKLTHFTQILSKILSYASFIFLVFGTITIIPVITRELSPMNIGIVVVYALLWVLNGKNLLKKSPWGMVMNKAAKQKLPLVLVRIINRKTGQLVRTAVSNESGRFSTFIDRGDYEIRALKAGYVLDKPIHYAVGKDKSTLSKTIEMSPKK